MTNFRNSVALVIEGVGNSVSFDEGYAFGFGPDPGHADYEWLEVLTQPPATVDSSTDPQTSQVTVSSFSFALSNTDAVAAALLYQQARAPWAVSSDHSSEGAIGTIDTTATAGEIASIPVWIGDEVLSIGTHTGTGTYNVLALGEMGTVAQDHASGAFIYTANSYIRYRKASLVIFDRDAGTATVRWRGFVDRLETNETGALLNVSCIEFLSALAGAKINRDQPGQLEQVHVERNKRNPVAILRAQLTDEPATVAHVAKTGDTTHEITYHIVGKDADTLITGTFTSGTVRFQTRAVNWAPSLEDFFSLSELRTGSEKVKSSARFHEVFIVDRLKDEGGTAADFVSSTRELAEPFHPLAIAMGFICSTYASAAVPASWDVYHGDWGLGVPVGFVDAAGIQATIDATPELKVDKFVLGLEGESVNIIPWVQEKLMRPFGLYFGTTEEGLLNANVLKSLTVDIYDAALSNPSEALPTQLRWSASRHATFNQITALVGETPWEPGSRILVLGIDGERNDSTRKALLGDPRAVELDYSVKNHGFNAWHLVNRAVVGHYAIPRIGVTVQDSSIASASYDHGKWVNLGTLDIQDAWLLDKSGTRVSVSSAVAPQLTGVVVGRSFNVANRTYSIELLLMAYRDNAFARFRAPAAEIVSATDGQTFVVELNVFNTGTTDDDDFFTVGDEVTLWSRDGVRVRDEAVPISSITAGTIVLDGNFTDTPAAGQILRLSTYDDYSNTAVLTNVDRAYAFVADAAETLGTANDAADIYGT